MNILIIFIIALTCLFYIWITQSIVLKFLGEPLAWPLRFSRENPILKYMSRIMIQSSWFIIIFGSCFALGVDPVDGMQKEFPAPIPWREITIAFSIIFFPACFGYAFMVKCGWMQIQPGHSKSVLRMKLFRRFLSPIPLAIIEETVFRGILLEQLLQFFPSSQEYTILAVVISSALFSLVHFIKPFPAGAFWQPAFGLFITGNLLGLAYIIGGNNLWLPVTIHATMILVLEVMRLYAVLKGPSWIVGSREFPQSGLIGCMFMLFAAIALKML